MKVQYLDDKREDKLIDVNDNRYLIRFYGTFKIEQVLVIEYTNRADTDTSQHRIIIETDYPHLKSMGYMIHDTGERIFLFWYSEYIPNELF